MINVLDKIKLGMSIGMHGESHNFKNGGQKATKKAALKKKAQPTRAKINKWDYIKLSFFTVK